MKVWMFVYVDHRGGLKLWMEMSQMCCWIGCVHHGGVAGTGWQQQQPPTLKIQNGGSGWQAHWAHVNMWVGCLSQFFLCKAGVKHLCPTLSQSARRLTVVIAEGFSGCSWLFALLHSVAVGGICWINASRYLLHPDLSTADTCSLVVKHCGLVIRAAAPIFP